MMEFRKFFKLHYLPILTGFWFLIGFVITFLMAILQNHVYIPFISDTGTIPPESCVFGFVLNIGALLILVTVYVRYRQIEFVQSMSGKKIHKCWNPIGLLLGILVSIGATIVGNYQETLVLTIHFIGAAMTFGFGALYLSIQTGISYYFRHFYENLSDIKIKRKVTYFQIFLSVCFCLATAIAGICVILALTKFKGASIPCWNESDGGFVYKLIATFAEWILFICFFIYLITMSNEYKLIEYEEIRFRAKFNTEHLAIKRSEEYSAAE